MEKKNKKISKVSRAIEELKKVREAIKLGEDKIDSLEKSIAQLKSMETIFCSFIEGSKTMKKKEEVIKNEHRER